MQGFGLGLAGQVRSKKAKCKNGASQIGAKYRSLPFILEITFFYIFWRAVPP
jgi:hypothetical protein